MLAAISAQLPARTSLAGHKRPLPVKDEADDDAYDTLSVHADAYGPLGHRDYSESDVDSLTGKFTRGSFLCGQGHKAECQQN